jgi:hypothetical protein
VVNSNWVAWPPLLRRTTTGVKLHSNLLLVKETTMDDDEWGEPPFLPLSVSPAFG